MTEETFDLVLRLLFFGPIALSVGIGFGLTILSVFGFFDK